MENRGKRQSASLFGSMGFYIALLACVVAAGATGYFALLEPPAPADSADSVPAAAPVDSVPAAAPAESLPADRPAEEPARQVLSDRPLPVTVVEQEPEPPAKTEVSAPVSLPRREEAVLVPPLEGETAAAFSVEQLIYDPTLGDWRTHDGVDILADEGAAVCACGAGTVLSVTDDDRMGTTVVIDHGDFTAAYASLLPGAEVLAGDRVEPGQIVGAVGATALSEAALGPHLHFSVSREGIPVDPAELLEKAAACAP